MSLKWRTEAGRAQKHTPRAEQDEARAPGLINRDRVTNIELVVIGLQLCGGQWGACLQDRMGG